MHSGMILKTIPRYRRWDEISMSCYETSLRKGAQMGDNPTIYIAELEFSMLLRYNEMPAFEKPCL